MLRNRLDSLRFEGWETGTREMGHESSVEINLTVHFLVCVISQSFERSRRMTAKAANVVDGDRKMKVFQIAKQLLKLVSWMNDVEILGPHLQEGMFSFQLPIDLHELLLISVV